ncbi:MAG: YjjG family noncanonical pyrimidine nucleotidase [Clostridia bacterium]|nr:YjjG family noncanonical pyrimidine nucleotidase [Clostridia bacterium]
MKYGYLLFDADNTLFDFDRCEREAFKEALSASSLGYSDEVYGDYHVINEGLWKKLERGEIERSLLKTERYRLLFEKNGVPDGSYKEVALIYEKCLGNQCYEIDGVYELLSDLSGKYGIYVITNGLTSVQESRFAKSRLTRFFDGVFISEKVGYAKPERAYFEYVVSAVGDSDISKYLVIGDSLTSDIDGALNFGFDSCWYNVNGQDANGRTPTYVINDINDVLKVL